MKYLVVMLTAALALPVPAAGGETLPDQQIVPVDQEAPSSVYKLEGRDVPLHIRVDRYFNIAGHLVTAGQEDELFRDIGLDPESEDARELRRATEAAWVVLHGPDGPTTTHEKKRFDPRLRGGRGAVVSDSITRSSPVRAGDLRGRSEAEARALHDEASERKVRQLAEVWGALSPDLQQVFLSYFDSRVGIGWSSTRPFHEDPAAEREAAFQDVVRRVQK